MEEDRANAVALVRRQGAEVHQQRGSRTVPRQDVHTVVQDRRRHVVHVVEEPAQRERDLEPATRDDGGSNPRNAIRTEEAT
ncbi:hypothetical protein AB0N26_18895 [Streptomyces cellulosae]